MKELEKLVEPDFGLCLAPGCWERAEGTFCLAHWHELTADEAQTVVLALERMSLRDFQAIVLEIRERLLARA